MKIQKTNAMRFLDKNRISYRAHTYEHKDGDPVDGIHVATLLNQPIDHVYKTLVLQANTKEYLVFMLPVDLELDLKKCAKVAKVKSVEMIHVKDINKITGYIRGGCSPLGMKKQFRTFINDSVSHVNTIYFSAGKIGEQIEMNPKDLIQIMNIDVVNIVKE